MKRILICGASSGIGRAAAERFAAEGWSVGLTARNEDALRTLRDGLPGEGHWLLAGDYAGADFPERLAGALRSRDFRLDALVNSAGIDGGSDAIDSPLALWRKPFDTMVNGAVQLTRGAAPFLAEGGRIVHVTSIHGFRAEKGASAYSMAKAALNQFCRALALELAPRGILVNALAPGFVDTPMSHARGINELETEWFRRNYVEGDHLPLRRAAKPEEIAGVIHFLCGPDASYITGQTIVADGGLSITF